MRTGRSRLSAVFLCSLVTATVGAAAVPAAASVPASAAGGASILRVTVIGDKGDWNVGDGVCDTTRSDATTKCTLRAAIQEANADPDPTTIRFRIRGGSRAIKTIQPTSPLPTITAPTTIDGYTQFGARENTAAPGTDAVLRVELDGRFVTAAGLTATAPVVIRGLSIYWFGRGIQLSAGSSGSRIMGNFIGTDASGTRDRGNDSSGILVNSRDVRIGSIVRADRNLISGNTSSGINLGIASRRTTIQGNLIGTGKNARRSIPNESHGVFITGSRGHLVGGTFTGQGNVIARNGGDGVSLISVRLSGDSLVPAGIRIANNSIFDNGGLGIDLANDGPTRNDRVPDRDTGPNGLQNFPRIESAEQTANGTTIRGFLASRRNTTYEVQLFASASGDPEGRTVLSTFTVNTGASGRVTFTRTIGSLNAGVLVTATATDVQRKATSEFSPARPVTP